MKMAPHKLNTLVKCVISLLLFLNTPLLFADLAAADRAEDEARKNFVQRFVDFLQDRNVMGKVTTPDGKPAQAGPAKTRFDRDDGISYRSDLTYHDMSFDSKDEPFEKKKKAAIAAKTAKDSDFPARSLPNFVSPHGGFPEAGGSSLLERTVYQLHEKFYQEHKNDKAKKDFDEKKGIKYESVFKIETRDVVKKGGTPGGGPTPSGAPKEELAKVERQTLRDEARPEIEKVGEQSGQTVTRAAKEKGSEDDPEALSNSTLLYEAAGRATMAWWNSTLANLGQRVINQGAPLQGELGSLGDSRSPGPQLWESTSTCGAWVKSIQSQIAKADANDPRIQSLQKELQQAQQQCQALAKQDYRTVNPRFEADKNGKQQLKTGEDDKNPEDGVERDLRNQLEVLQSAGKDVTKLQSNWKYDASEDKQQVTIGYDENGQPNDTEKLSVKEQLDSYNKQLDAAEEGFKEVKERVPQLQINEKELDQFKIQPESRSVMDINGISDSMKEDLGVDPNAPPTADQTPSQTYEDLTKKNGAQ